MKIVYSLPHPNDRLEDDKVGHIVRANNMLQALETLGHTVIRVQAAAGGGAGQSAVKGYRQLVKNLLPPFIARPMRDRGRVLFSQRYADRLTEVVEREQPDILLETHIAFSLGGVLASQRSGVPLVYDDVAPSWEEQEQYGVGSNTLALDVHRQAMAQASIVVAVSESIKEALLKDGIAAQKIITVHNGVTQEMLHNQPDAQSIRERYAIPPDAQVVLFVGSFQPFHRVDLLVDAVNQLTMHPAPYLLLVGGNADMIASHKLPPNTIFTGRIAHEQVADHIAIADVTVMPATNTYGNPMKIYEYLAMGKPVIAPDQPTIREIGGQDQGIHLFEKESAPALRDAVQQLLTNDGYRLQLGANAMSHRADHAWLERGRQLADAMQMILSQKK